MVTTTSLPDLSRLLDQLDQQQHAHSSPSLGALASLILVLGILLVLSRRARLYSRRAAKKRLPAQTFDPPRSEHPAVVALVATEGVRLPREAVGANVLWLASKGVIRLDGLTSERFVLSRTQRGLARATEPDLLVLNQIDALLSTRTDSALAGPPLWPTNRVSWWPRYRRAVRDLAVSRGYLKREFPPAQTVPGLIAAGAIPLLGDHSAGALVGAAIAAAIFGALPFVAGWGLTAKGQVASSQWASFARQLKTGDFESAGAPAVAIWNDYLAYAAVLVKTGGARGLSPSAGHERVGLLHWGCSGRAIMAPAAPR